MNGPYSGTLVLLRSELVFATLTWSWIDVFGGVVPVQVIGPHSVGVSGGVSQPA